MSSLTNKKINQGQLLKLLSTLQYVNIRATGGHLIFKHPNSNSVIALRHARKNEIVPIFIAASVYRNIVDNKIMSPEKLLEEIEEL